MFYVLLVPTGNDDFGDSCTMGAKDLLLGATDGSDVPAESDFACHGDVGGDGRACEE